MYVDIVPNRTSKPAILLRENWREDGKVRKRTLANLSDLTFVSWLTVRLESFLGLLAFSPLRCF